MSKALALCLSCCLVAACGGDDEGTSPPGGSTTVGTGDTDSSVAEPVEDAGTDDDGGAIAPRSSCTEVDPKGVDNEDLTDLERPSHITEPADFTVTSAHVTWEGKCTEPKLKIRLTDGLCPRGGDHHIDFYVDAATIRDGAVIKGENVIAGEPNTDVEVRYIRPEDLEVHGSWGTCSGASGTIAFLTEPTVTTRSEWVVKFQLVLTDCSGADLPQAPQVVGGGFKVRLPQTVTDRCPSWK